MADLDDASPSGHSDEPRKRRAAQRRPARLRRAGMFESLPAVEWHVLPGADHFLHEPSPACPCHPLVERQDAPSVGGVAWFRHRLIQPAPVDDVFPARWAS
jgi:hypothetical protein